MSHASILPAAPLLDPAVVMAVARAARMAARAGGLVLGSVAAAAVVWLVLAGPGFMADGASTVRPARVAAR